MTGYRVNFVKVQQQIGSVDCGVYACAFAVQSSQRKESELCNLDQLELRKKFNYFLVL